MDQVESVFIRFAVFILIGLSVVRTIVDLIHSVKTHERATRKLDREIEDRVGLKLKNSSARS